jgi:lipid-binding SYLF domain-containing protein
VTGGSWGLQIAGEAVDVVMLVMNDQGMEKMLSSKFKIGADASAAAGPVGRHVEGTTDWKMRAEVLTYSRARGVFAGGLTGALVGMGIPEYEAKRYEGRVKDGGILLSVHSDDSQWTKRAKEILERTGAQDVSSTGEAASEKGDKTRVREVA